MSLLANPSAAAGGMEQASSSVGGGGAAAGGAGAALPQGGSSAGGGPSGGSAPVWAIKSVVVAAGAVPTDVAVADGKATVVGSFQGAVSFGPTPLVTAPGDEQIFVVQYATNGSHLWSSQLGEEGGDFASAVAVGPAGEVALSGHTKAVKKTPGNPAVFGQQILISRLHADGQHAWTIRGDVAYSTGGNSWSGDIAHDIAIDAHGHVHVVGAILTNTDFGGPSPPPSSSSAGLVLELDAQGSHVFSTRLGKLNDWNKIATQIAVCDEIPGKRVVALTAKSGVFDFGGPELPAKSWNDVAIGQLSAQGEHEWSVLAGSYGSGSFRLVPGPACSTYLLNTGVLYLTNSELPSQLARVSSTGGLLWAIEMNGVIGRHGNGVAVVRSHSGQQGLLLVDAFGQIAPVMTLPPSLVAVAIASSDAAEIVVAGYFLKVNPVDFGDGPLSCAKDVCMVVVRFGLGE